MGRTTLRYWALLIGGYLALAYATGFGQDLTAATNFIVGDTRALQGR